MRYPYLLYSPRVRHAPVFSNLKGDPFVIDLSYRNAEIAQMDPRDQRAFQTDLDSRMSPNHTWGFSGYLERRDTLLRDCPQMVAEGRYFHLGLDVIVPKNTPLHAPLEGFVADAGYESGEGNYGGWVLLRHDFDGIESFYSFYGHLCADKLPAAGGALAAGEAFAETGDFHENGNWFYHTHIQIITEKGYEQGYISKGYCSTDALAEISELCPNPVPLFKI